jgi:hypothetical protein
LGPKNKKQILADAMAALKKGKRKRKKGRSEKEGGETTPSDIVRCTPPPPSSKRRKETNQKGARVARSELAHSSGAEQLIEHESTGP